MNRRIFKMKRFAVILILILLFGSLIPFTQAKLPIFPMTAPFLKWDTGVPGYYLDEYTPKAERIPNSDYILFYNGTTLSTIRFWSNNGTIQNKYTSQYAMTDPGKYVHMVHVSGSGTASGDIYAVFGSKHTVRTYRVWGTNGTVQQKELSTQAMGSNDDIREPSITKLTGNLYACITYDGSSLYVSSFRIDNTTGVIHGALSNLSINAYSNPSGWTELMPGDDNSFFYSYRSNTRSYLWTCTFTYSNGGLSGGTENMLFSDRYCLSMHFNKLTSTGLYAMTTMDENKDWYVYTFWYWANNDTFKKISQNGFYGTTDVCAGGAEWLGRGQLVVFAGDYSNGDGYMALVNVTDTGSTAGAIQGSGYYKVTFPSTSYYTYYPSVNISTAGSQTNLWAFHEWDVSQHHNWYVFYRNETTDYTISWKTAATWNGTLFNDTLYQQIPWNGTLFNLSPWQSIEWNGTFWNNSRIWRTTFLNERFTLTPNNAPSVTDTAWRGQSFTIGKTGANTNFYLHSIALSLRKDAVTDPALLYTVRVYAAAADHTPTGPILGTATISTGRATTSFTWINCSGCAGPSPLLTAGTTYVMILFKNTPSAYNIRWGTRNNATTPGSASYTGGYSITSSNSGGTWSLATGIDCDFMVWGSTVSDFPSIWNGTFYNLTIAWKIGSDWNGTLYNATLWSVTGLWNGTLFNFSHGYPILVSQWNGTLWNDTFWSIHGLWNGTLYNLTLYQQIGLWNGSIWNSTHFMPAAATWNGTLTSVVHLTLHVHGNGWISRSPVFIPYSLGDTVNCTATAGMLYLFHDIMGVTGTNVYVVTLDKDRVVYANFTTNTSTGYDFTYTDDTDLPKITDVINANTSTDEGIFEWSRVFTYAWVWALGGWFFALVLGVIGGAIFLQYKRVEVVAAYFIIILILFGAVTSSIGYVAGILVALILGFLIYRVLKIKR